MTVNRVLGFEQGGTKSSLNGWFSQPPATVSGDQTIVHGGRWSARLTRRSDSDGTFSVLTKDLPRDFAGDKIELRGFLRMEGVDGFAGLWLRQDGAAGEVLSFDNMEHDHLNGTAPWTLHAVTLPIHKEARTIVFGALLAGTGQVWIDDLQLLVDGKPIADAGAMRPVPTVLDTVHDFDGGSGLRIDAMSDVQSRNLATLGRVWGFLKYHHPAVISGRFHWDYEFLRILPAVLKATTEAEAEAVLVRWIDGLGAVPPCKPCIHLKSAALAMKPDLGWISDEALLGTALSSRLRSIYENRPGGPEFYVSLQPETGNAVFNHELSYTTVKYPDAGFQLLALFRFWNILQYWAPDREVAGQNWPEVLREFIPKVVLARDYDAYQLVMMALIAKTNDTHANLWSALKLRPPVGVCQLPVNVRFLGDQAVVSGYATEKAGHDSGLQAGDVFQQIDGKSVSAMVEQWTPLYADSNQSARLRDMSRALTGGLCGPVSVLVRRGNESISLNLSRLPTASMENVRRTHDVPGDTFRLLSNDVAYLKLSSIKVADLPRYMELAGKTKGLIVDIRNYPSEFVVFALGQRLVDHPTPFALFTQPDLSNPGAFVWSQPESLIPQGPHYAGKVVVLVDEVSVSQSEYTAMAFHSAPKTVIVGSTTAGADGDVSGIALPGGLKTQISGLGVFYPDRTPTQRVGIHVDVQAIPTVEGIGAGRDEVLEVGLRQILGANVSPAEIERLARP